MGAILQFISYLWISINRLSDIRFTYIQKYSCISFDLQRYSIKEWTRMSLPAQLGQLRTGLRCTLVKHAHCTSSACFGESFQ